MAFSKQQENQLVNLHHKQKSLTSTMWRIPVFGGLSGLFFSTAISLVILTVFKVAIPALPIFAVGAALILTPMELLTYLNLRQTNKKINALSAELADDINQTVKLIGTAEQDQTSLLANAYEHALLFVQYGALQPNDQASSDKLANSLSQLVAQIEQLSSEDLGALQQRQATQLYRFTLTGIHQIVRKAHDLSPSETTQQLLVRYDAHAAAQTALRQMRVYKDSTPATLIDTTLPQSSLFQFLPDGILKTVLTENLRIYFSVGLRIPFIGDKLRAFVNNSNQQHYATAEAEYKQQMAILNDNLPRKTIPTSSFWDQTVLGLEQEYARITHPVAIKTSNSHGAVHRALGTETQPTAEPGAEQLAAAQHAHKEAFRPVFTELLAKTAVVEPQVISANGATETTDVEMQAMAACHRPSF